MNKVMSEKGSKSNKEEQAPDLSALDFGPSWARADKGSSTKGNSRSGSASESAKSPRSRKGGQRGDSRGNSRGREAKGHGRDGGRHSGKDNRHGGAGRDHRSRRDMVAMVAVIRVKITVMEEQGVIIAEELPKAAVEVIFQKEIVNRGTLLLHPRG